ncbi:unnamed protein product [Rotaria magnacalcarata]
MASLSSSSSLKRSIDDIEESEENILSNKKINYTLSSFKVRIIDMFKDANLIAPTQLLEVIDQSDRKSAKRCDSDRRKEVYKSLCWYLDCRHLRGVGQTYVYPVQLSDLIRKQYPANIHNYTKIKTTKNGSLVVVKEEDKFYVQLSDFCKSV